MEAVYEVPFLSHSPLEPMNCVAHWRDDGVEIWAPTQAPQWARGGVAQALRVAPEKVTVHVTFVGGAFGRRIMPDFAIEAVQISKAAGLPVQVVWSREDDMHHDFYRPASRHLMSAGLDANGGLVAWKHRVVSPSIIGSVLGANAQPAAGEATGGAADLPYTVPNIRVDHCLADTAVPTGWCRSVFSTQTPFANECFLDEIAAAQGKDRLAQTYGWFMGLGASEIPQHLAAAERYSRGLPRRDSLLIRGSKLAEVDGDMDAIPLFEDLVARYADDVEAWHGLGDALFHMGAQANRPITAAIGPLERTLALDPTTRPRSFT